MSAPDIDFFDGDDEIDLPDHSRPDHDGSLFDHGAEVIGTGVAVALIGSAMIWLRPLLFGAEVPYTLDKPLIIGGIIAGIGVLMVVIGFVSERSGD